MTTVKKLAAMLFLCFSLAILVTGFASAENIVIKFKDGSVKVIPLSDIESISFSGGSQGSIPASDDPITSKATLEKMLKMYNEGNFNVVFDYIGNRKCTGVLTDKEKQKYGDDILKDIKKFARSKPELGEIHVEFEGEGQWNVIPVTYETWDEFTDEITKVTKQLAFLQVNDRWLLCDID